MENLNYFTGEFSESELKNYFDSLNEEKLKYELKNFINQYLDLDEEEQLKYARIVLVICSEFEKQIDKEIEKKLLEFFNKLFVDHFLNVSNFVIRHYLYFLYSYFYKELDYEDYSTLIDNNSLFLYLCHKVTTESLTEDHLTPYVIDGLLSVFLCVFAFTRFDYVKRVDLEKNLIELIDVIFKNINLKLFEIIDFWYFRLDELVSIFQFEHLKIINNYFMENPQSEDIDAYLDFIPRHFKDETEVDKSLSKLKQIFEKLQELKDEKALIDFSEKLKKISYLFKVKDYEYEMEYRILINLDDTSVKKLIAEHNKSLDKNKDLLNENYLKKEEIGLEIFDKVNYNDFRKYIVLSPKDKGRYDLFVYINLAPLKYSKVILGPKVTDADYIAPYLKLANPDIEIESSKIPYRGA